MKLAPSAAGPIGIFAGIVMVAMGFFTSTNSAIHQIYQNQLTVGGFQTIMLGAIASNTKRREDSQEK